jgi:hypothetical protein
VEVGLSWLSLALAVVTLAWQDWAELAFGLDPDHGSGAAEWLIVALGALVALTCAGLARAEWRRAATARAD